VNDFRRLVVWQRAHEAALESYRATRAFPSDERFGLTAQLRRAAVSVAANIAEGCGRASARDEGRFLQIALGSARELEYHLLLARDLGLLDPEAHARLHGLSVATQKMLTALLLRASRSPSRGHSREPPAVGLRPSANG